MSGWIKCSDRLPDLCGKKDYDCAERVMAFRNGRALPLIYCRQMYSKTEKGREPRWQDMRGQIAAPPSHWMPYPDPPEE